jgi:hypothetical protein
MVDTNDEWITVQESKKEESLKKMETFGNKSCTRFSKDNIDPLEMIWL